MPMHLAFHACAGNREPPITPIGNGALPHAANNGQAGGLPPDQRAALQRLGALLTSRSSQLLRICALALASALLAIPGGADVLASAGVQGAALMAYMWREGPKLWESLGTDGCTRMSSLSNGLWTLLWQHEVHFLHRCACLVWNMRSPTQALQVGAGTLPSFLQLGAAAALLLPAAILA